MKGAWETRSCVRRALIASSFVTDVSIWSKINVSTGRNSSTERDWESISMQMVKGDLLNLQPPKACGAKNNIISLTDAHFRKSKVSGGQC